MNLKVQLSFSVLGKNVSWIRKCSQKRINTQKTINLNLHKQKYSTESKNVIENRNVSSNIKFISDLLFPVSQI